MGPEVPKPWAPYPRAHPQKFKKIKIFLNFYPKNPENAQKGFPGLLLLVLSNSPPGRHVFTAEKLNVCQTPPPFHAKILIRLVRQKFDNSLTRIPLSKALHAVKKTPIFASNLPLPKAEHLYVFRSKTRNFLEKNREKFSKNPQKPPSLPRLGEEAVASRQKRRKIKRENSLLNFGPQPQ